MAKITYIIPIHEYNKEVEKYFKKAIDSLKNLENNEDNKVILIGPKTAINKAHKIYDLSLDVTLIENNETDFFTQVNKAVLQCITPYFSILEFDDEYMPYWIREAEVYSSNGASVLLPINEYTDGEKTISLGNEIAWSIAFSNIEERGLGYLDMDCLNAFMDFNVTGALIKTEDFITLGGLKPSLKIAAWYEFLLRMAYNHKLIYVVPKIGYKHLINRPKSYMKLNEIISSDEGKWLIETAKQEYFFKEDRNKKFGEIESEPEENK